MFVNKISSKIRIFNVATADNCKEIVTKISTGYMNLKYSSRQCWLLFVFMLVNAPKITSKIKL